MQQNPEVALTVLEYSPLPSEVVQQLRTIAEQPNPQQQQDQQLANQAKQLALQDQAAKIENMQARSKLDENKSQEILARITEILSRAQLERMRAHRENALADVDMTLRGEQGRREDALATADLLERARDFHKPIPEPSTNGQAGAPR
jgi:outer membrane murein-binding lipoprotein Lpp